MPGRFPPRLTCAFVALLAVPSSQPQSKAAVNEPSAFPSPETLSYTVEWRLILAGDAHLSLEPRKWNDKTEWEFKLEVESGGLVSKLYKIDDKYQMTMEDQICTTATNLDAMEGKRHHEVKVTYDYSRGKASYVERDLVKNISKTAEDRDTGLRYRYSRGSVQAKDLEAGARPEYADSGERRQEDGVGSRGGAGARTDQNQGGNIQHDPL